MSKVYNPRTGKYESIEDIRKSNGELGGPKARPSGAAPVPTSDPRLTHELETLRAQLAEIQANNAGRPERPDFISPLDGNNVLQAPYQLGYNGIGDNQNLQLDDRAYDALMQRGLAEGPSSWSLMMRDRIGQDLNQARDQTTHASRVGMAQGMNQLAATGGFDAGSRERMARSSAMQNQLGLQGVAATGAQAYSNLGLEDERQKLEIQKMLPGMDLARKGFRADLSKFDNAMQMDASKFNISNTLGGIDKQNLYKAGMYASDMGEWGANKTAGAIANSGKKS